MTEDGTSPTRNVEAAGETPILIPGMTPAPPWQALIGKDWPAELALTHLSAALDVHMIVIITDDTGRILHANDKLCAISGYSREEFIGQDPRLLNSGHHPKFFFADLWATLASGRSWRGEIKNRAKDGSGFWVDTTVYPLLDPNGKPGHYLALQTDITSLKQAEEEVRRLNESLEHQVAERTEELRKSEAQLRDAQRVGHMGSWQLDHLTGRLAWSDEIYRIFEIDPTAFGASYQTFLDAVHPEDRDEVNRTFSASVRDHQPYEIIHRLRTPDGRIKHVQERGETQYDPDGRAISSCGTVLDITERKRAEHVVQNSLQLLRSVVENAPVRVFWKDLDLRYKGCNSWFARDAGFTSPAEIIGKTDFELGWKDQAEAYRADDRAVMEGGLTKLGYEEPQTTPDGALIWLRTSKVPLHDEAGNITGILGIYDDVTARKTAEQALRDSERRFRRLFEDSAEAILLLEHDRFIDCNAAALAMLGMRELDQVRGLPPHSFSPRFQPDGRSSEEKAREMVLQAFEKGSHLFEWVHLRSNGEPFTTEVLLTPIQDPNRRLLHVVWRDITERKRSENELRETHDRLTTLFEGARDAIFIADDITGEILDANATASELLGLPKDAILRRRLEDLHPADQAAAYLEQLRGSAERGARVFEAEVLRVDGCRIPVEITASVGTLATGRRVIQGFYRDVHARKQLEAQIMRNQRLESIGTLAGGVAHDLNNALAPILLVTELIRSQYPAEDEMVDIIATSARRAAEMVKQLLTFARGVEGERQNLQTVHLLREIEKIVRSTFPKNILLRTVFAKNLRTVLGDATQLHQVLLNLCVNARDAMAHGGTLTIEAENVDLDDNAAAEMPDASAGPHVVWRIKDTGMGIHPENLDRIFDPFFTTKAPEMGTGLGLSTALGIVRSHHGFIQVRSTLKQGTTFAIFLPAAEPLVPAPQPAPEITAFRGRGESILFVDDEPAVRLAAQSVLQRLNFNPILAVDGVDGLARASAPSTQVRAVITDQHMPHMDGLNFVRVLRRFLPDVPIAVASGRLDPATLEEYQSLGVRHQIDKPFSEIELAEMLRKLLAD